MMTVTQMDGRTKQEAIKWQIMTLLVPVAQGRINGFDTTGKILSYLHSQGVVIKVDRMLPEFYTSKIPTAVGREDVVCGFYEPLIKE